MIDIKQFVTEALKIIDGVKVIHENGSKWAGAILGKAMIGAIASGDQVIVDVSPLQPELNSQVVQKMPDLHKVADQLRSDPMNAAEATQQLRKLARIIFFGQLMELESGTGNDKIDELLEGKFYVHIKNGTMTIESESGKTLLTANKITDVKCFANGYMYIIANGIKLQFTMVS